MKKIISVVLCLVFVFALSACGDKKDETPQVTDPANTTKAHQEVKKEPLKVPFEGTVEEVSVAVITVDTEDFKTRILAPTSATINDVDGMAPTVLDAVKQIFDANNVKYEEKDGMFTSIMGKAEGEKDGYNYVWEFKINDSDLITYAASTRVEKGDHIVLYLNPYKVK